MNTLRLNDTISLYRKKLGFTQEELARKLGVTNQSVSKWETAQCYPDVTLLPKLAEIYDISIDELFGKEPPPQDGCHLPMSDENTCRVVVVCGNQVVAAENLDKPMQLEFPKHCPEHFKVEVFGSIECESGVYGDVVVHGNIECMQVNGDIKECNGYISCNGSINGSVNSGSFVSSGGGINGGVNCGNNVSCGGNVNGAVCCGDNVSCGGDIQGNVECGGNVECRTVEGNVECKGDVIYRLLRGY